MSARLPTDEARRNAVVRTGPYDVPDKIRNYRGTTVDDWNVLFRLWGEVDHNNQVYCTPHERPVGSWSEAIADMLGWTFLTVTYAYAKRVTTAKSYGMVNDARTGYYANMP